MAIYTVIWTVPLPQDALRQAFFNLHPALHPPDLLYPPALLYPPISFIPPLSSIPRSPQGWRWSLPAA
jgi:hypothetical protein